jgi:hypothetical protein
VLDFWVRFNQNRHVRKVTGSKITTFYAVLSICYCAIQVVFLAASWQVNHGAGRQLEVLVEISGNGAKEYSYLDYKSGSPQLRLCPGGISTADHGEACPVIWPPKSSNETSPRIKRADSQALTFFPSNGTLDVPPYDGLTFNRSKPTSTITLGPECVQAIKWPYHHLLLLRREDVSSACFHSWLLLLSAAALMTESIPHIGASFALHVFALWWSSIQIWATKKFETDYSNLIIGSQGACAGIDVISGYFKDRTAYQIATIAVNIVSTIASGFLCWRLFGMYGWVTFKKMGASRTIARAYKIALALAICVHLELFFYTAAVTCFLDQIAKGLLGSEPQHRTLLLVSYTITTVLAIPWLSLGSYGIRRENKKMMYGFFTMSLLYLGMSGAMFSSNTFKRTFEYWVFVAASFTVSWALLVAIIILAIFCTLNFGKGLPHYFERRNGEDADDYNDDFHPSPGEKNGDLESVTFPSTSSNDAEVVAFPSRNNSTLVPVKRSDSAFSHMSQESRGSTRLPPLQVANDRDRPHIVVPQAPNAVLSRNLTASTQSQATGNSSFSPSWSTGDDRAMMANQQSVQRYLTTSSFGNLDRESSFGTQASSNIIVNTNFPQRSLTSSSKASVATTSSSRSYGSMKRRIDLGEEL